MTGVGHMDNVSMCPSMSNCMCICACPSLTCEHVRCETSTQGRASLSLTQYSHHWEVGHRQQNHAQRAPAAQPFMPPRGRPTLVVLSPVASSSLSRRSSLPRSAMHAAAACRSPSLALAASPASRRNSALLAAYFGPSSLLLYVLCGRAPLLSRVTHHSSATIIRPNKH